MAFRLHPSCVAKLVLVAFAVNYLNLSRSSTGRSKEMLLSLVAAKSLMNGQRVMHPDANLAPMIWVDEESAAFLVAFKIR